MKLKDFENLTPGTQVIIKGRRAKLFGNIHITSRPSQFDHKDYGWAFFRYMDTGRSVTKRHRQVELVLNDERQKCERAEAHAHMLGYPDASDIEVGK